MKTQIALIFILPFLTTASWGQGRQTMKWQSDTELQSMARRSLDRDSELSFDAKNVNVKVENRRAFMQGFLNSPEEADMLRKKVLAIDGVMAVTDKTISKE